MKYYAPTKLSENISETPEGYLLCLAVPIARTGEMEYGKGETPLEVGDDGIVRVSRAPEEVFRPETIASFEGKPFTIKHPEDFVDPENWKDLAKGVMQNVRRGEGEDKDNLVADILITDSFAISLVKNGLRGLSCGYEAEYEQTGKGKGRQSNIIGNHLALVEEGRAGSQYAINDSKGTSMKKQSLVERVKKAFGIALDEAMKDEEVPVEKKKEEKKSSDEGGLDEVKKLVGDLLAKIDGMSKPKDEEDEEDEGDEEEKPVEKKKEEDAPEESKLEERLKAVEAALAKLMEHESGDDDEEESEESESGDEEDESKDSDDADDSAMSGDTSDTASRAEILSPGIKSDAKDIKVKALKAAYGTKDGKKVIDQLTGGKPPSFESKDQVETLFVAASEVMKASRGTGLQRTKVNDFQSSIFVRDGEMTPEKMNEINAKHFGKQA